MRHQVKKIKFSLGRDANRMLMRKLSTNFLIKGKLETTLEKAKNLKSVLERLIGKSLNKTEANKNFLLRQLGNAQLVNLMFDDIGPKVKAKTSGFIRMIKLGTRSSDGSEIAKLEWTLPVVVEKKAKVVKEQVEEKVEKSKK